MCKEKVWTRVATSAHHRLEAISQLIGSEMTHLRLGFELRAVPIVPWSSVVGQWLRTSDRGVAGHGKRS